MRPIKLRIKGLNSFIEEQVIDFETLTDRGLFGIFGPTGSGKSTILDGITLALYGDLSRKSSNYINTNCDRLNINFEFQISGSEIKRYSIDREFKRKKDTGSPQSGKCKLVDITYGESDVIADKVTTINEAVKQIVGLSLEDFTRTVVLPQGKFSEFLKLEGKERRNMLERLFNLQQYGDHLSSKLIREINKVKTNNNVLLGQLIGYEDVNEEKLEEKSLLLSKASDNLDRALGELQLIEESFKEKETLWNLQLELESYKNEETKLKMQECEVLKKEEILKEAEACEKVVPYINAYENTIKELETCEVELKSLSLIIQELTSKKADIEKGWDLARDEKDIKLPKLVVKKQKAEDAILDNNALNQIIADIEILKGRICNGEAMDANGEVTLNRIIDDLQSKNDKLKTSEATFESLKVEEHLKQKVNQGLMENEKKATYLDSLNKIKSKINDCNTNIKASLSKQELLNDGLSKKNLDLIKLQSELETLISPGEQKDLLELQGLVSQSKEKWAIYNKAKKEIKEDKESIEVLNRDIEIAKEESEKCEQRLQELRSSLKEVEIENLAQTLRKELTTGEVCPVCGSLEHQTDNIKSVDVIGCDELENKIKMEDANLKQLSIRCTTNETKKIGLVDKIDRNEAEIKALGEEFKNNTPEVLEESFEKMKLAMESYLKMKESSEKTIDNLKESITNIKGELSTLSVIIASQSEQVLSLESDYKDTTLKMKTTDELLETLIKDTGVTNFKEKNKEINEMENRREEISKSIKLLRKSIEELNKIKEETQIKNNSVKNALITCNSKLEILIKNQEEKSLAIRQKVGEESNLNQLLLDLNTEISNIEDRFKLLDESKKSIEKQYTENNNQYISIKTKSEELIKRRVSDKENLDILIENTGFKSLEEVKSKVLKSDVIKKLREDINLYNESLAKLNGAIESLLKKINSKELLKEDWENAKNEKLKKEEEVKSITEDKIKLQEEEKIIKDKIQELSTLLNKKKEIEHKLALLGDLEKLFKGKKFVEFVATSKLKYISIEASKRLKEITSGSYGLEVDDFGKFIIRDYKNGGAERDASTLSGGETFLASLALALALSAQIQLKGTAPLELFFLDEGFGTLDDNLLEVVMSSLERIHNDKLKVGIISHVESIKNRVPVKLILTPAESGMGGSKVKIERS